MSTSRKPARSRRYYPRASGFAARWLLYAQEDQRDSGITLVENFQ